MAAPASATTDPSFAPNSYRNVPLADSAPLDTLSPLYVQDLAAKVSQSGAFLNHSSYSVPIYTVGADQPRTQVVVDDPNHQSCAYGNPCLIEQWRSVPLPADAEASPGTDGHLVVYQPSADSLWEFWRFARTGGVPHAYYGGRITGVSQNPGYFTSAPGTQFGAAGTSIPLLVGLQQISELQSGSIDHVVSFAMNSPQRGFRWPAQRGDGSGLLPTAATEGTCFRLPATLAIESLGLTSYGRMLARAVQKYGMVTTDATSSGLVFFGEIPTNGTDPYAGASGILGGADDSAGAGGVLRNFPWSQLQALAAGTC